MQRRVSLGHGPYKQIVTLTPWILLVGVALGACALSRCDTSGATPDCDAPGDCPGIPDAISPDAGPVSQSRLRTFSPQRASPRT